MPVQLNFSEDVELLQQEQAFLISAAGKTLVQLKDANIPIWYKGNQQWTIDLLKAKLFNSVDLAREACDNLYPQHRENVTIFTLHAIAQDALLVNE